MPEISFYITDNERMELFDFIVANQGKFIVDTLYDNTETAQVETSQELIERIQLESQTLFFVVSSAFQIEPLIMRKNRFYDDNKYYIEQRTGGPYISISCAIGYAIDNSIKYKRTNIHYYCRYLHYDWQTNFGEFSATEELKSYYKMIVKFLKSKCRQVTTKNGKKYWVSKTLKEKDVI